MGEAKRRKEAQARGFGKTSKTPQITTSSNIFYRTLHQISEIEDVEFQQNREKSPYLALLWSALVTFHNHIDNYTLLEIVDFWQKYWEKAAYLLGEIELSEHPHLIWISNIKTMRLMILKNLEKSLKNDNQYFLEHGTTLFSSMAETTIEVALSMYRPTDCIIYYGKNLVVYKGYDSIELQGELMIAVKHVIGCWSLYPFPHTLSVPFSDYKQAKLALKKYPTSLKGELVHYHSSKLAKLLGLTIKGNYAYLIK
ncbi:MAG: hypothetical protein EAZ78_00275 [Oscillatoriales cyanobacterium]|uniref:Uncharacterized protein n=1 Tax=Microcoleus anatoxicus PTRS2 TaxID=2705321 RepID=A0ABU8YVQ8_9CYAN|nr:MAG: hypothetical protein EA000_06685 [Oscillatoriales cyanobacterium]TAD96236.1 MAG: hypothetical protein EAZ96_26170 [Oscillatoriales cyanobacterium]TAE03396.1 MAG: hypothetical protein EAZ98_00420 [Oscillatoriales cyanobacterium]TAF07332.1 MAG: hypothetical protein EAZ78_00275 [Oscillatoriales cyanobacterium]TAF36318.1 MAG: hypothetical protein EAZ68_16940 [Oscillatoriales cyanobacterium]